MFWIGHMDDPGSGRFNKDINELAKEGNRNPSGMAFLSWPARFFGYPCVDDFRTYHLIR
jgi:hypothetical protein